VDVARAEVVAEVVAEEEEEEEEEEGAVCPSRCGVGCNVSVCV
jgi:hypothetical protein